MSASLDEILSNFELLEDWEERYRYLIELGRMMPPLPEEARIDRNKVMGCASQVWLEVSSSDRTVRRCCASAATAMLISCAD